MPNWCSNSIVIEGDPNDLKDFDKRFKGKHVLYEGGSSSVLEESLFKKKEELEKSLKEGEILAYKIAKEGRPNPFDDSKRLWHDYNFITKMVEKEGYAFANFVPMSKEDFLNGWYEWACKNWGTKWDASDIYPYMDEFEDGRLVYNFQTAWAPSLMVTKKMAELYPSLKFTHNFVEEGCSIAGVFKFENGQLVSELQAEGFEDIREFLQEHLGYEYFRCVDCNELLEEWEFGDNYEDQDFEEGHICPHCGSKNVKDVAGNLIE